jgi:hypothetical protein
MNGINKCQAVLGGLREAGEPISVADCATKFASKLGIPSEPQNLSAIAHRLSAVLTQLTTAGRVRQSGQFDGRRFCGRSPLSLPRSCQVACYPARTRKDSLMSGEIAPCPASERMASVAHLAAVLAPREVGYVTV